MEGVYETIGVSGVRWCWVERGVAVERGLAGWWTVEAPPLEIGEEASLEVEDESLLELEGCWERVGGGSYGWLGRFQFLE